LTETRLNGNKRSEAMTGSGAMVETKPEFRLTGAKVLLLLVGFFVTIMAVNFLMAYYAIHTFSGMQTEKPYESGLAYNRAIAEAKALTALGWKADIHSDRSADGTVSLDVSMADTSGIPLADLAVHARLRSPIDSKRDHEVAFSNEGNGLYRGSTGAEAGQWDLEVSAERNGAVQFRSVNRIVLH
jgi:nitrogen fixation protein FixH